MFNSPKELADILIQHRREMLEMEIRRYEALADVVGDRGGEVGVTLAFPFLPRHEEALDAQTLLIGYVLNQKFFGKWAIHNLAPEGSSPVVEISFDDERDAVEYKLRNQ